MAERFSVAVGNTLRQARRKAGLTLSDVRQRSRGKFKPSSVGGYERGERAISLVRFASLAAVYGVHPDELLAEVLTKLSPEAWQELRIDVSRLQLVPSDVARPVAEHVHLIQAKRGDYMSDIITLRSGDVEKLAQASRIAPRTLLATLTPALAQGAGS